MQDDQHIIREMQAGNRQAVSWLYDKYAPTLYGIALKIVQSDMEAEDIVQESFVKAWKNCALYEQDKGRLFTWLLNITRNAAIDRTRSAAFKKQEKIQTLEPSVYRNKATENSFNPDTINLRQNVHGLEERYRVIIELIYFQGFTQKEVEEHLDIPLGTVKSRLRIALRELRKLFLEHSNGQLISLFYLLFFCSSLF